jgi:hypothetical protein
MQGVGCPGEVLMCKVLYTGKGEGRLLVYDHRSCILSGASSSHVQNLLFICIINETAGDWGERGGGGRGGGLSSNSQDSDFSHILGNDAKQGLVFNCPQGVRLTQLCVEIQSSWISLKFSRCLCLSWFHTALTLWMSKFFQR